MQMQVNNTTQTQNFGSTRLAYSKIKELPLNKITEKIEPYYELKGFWNNANDKFIKNPQKFADKIEGHQAAIVHSADGDIVIIGKDGGSAGSDGFLGRLLTSIFGDGAKYTDDIKPIESDMPPIDMTKIRG